MIKAVPKLANGTTHIKKYGTTTDGRIFQTARGGILQDSGYNEVWTEARKQALTPAQYRYDYPAWELAGGGVCVTSPKCANKRSSTSASRAA